MSETDKMKEIIVERLKKIRGEKTQERFSADTKIEFETYRKIEQKSIVLSIENALKISKACNVSLDYIYGMSDDINKEISSINTAIRNIIGIKENIVQERNFDNELMYTSTLDISLNECLHQLLIDIGKIKTTNLPEDKEKQAIEALELKYNEKVTELKENGDNKIVRYVLFPLEN